MNAASVSATHTYSVTYSAVTGKVTIENTHVSGDEFKILWNTGTNTRSLIASMLGFSDLVDLLFDSWLTAQKPPGH